MQTATMEAKKDLKKLTEDLVKQGGVQALLYFDIHAATSEDVQNLGVGFINQLIKTPGVVYAMGEIDEPLAVEEGKNVSSSIEVKLLTRNFLTLANLCLVYSPFNIEILKPDSVQIPLNEAHELLGQLSATTAEYKKTIITKLAKPEELAEFQKQLRLRAEMGKKILDKKE